MRGMSKLGTQGAVELSIGTIVISTLAMSMLILGIVLVKNIFFSFYFLIKFFLNLVLL